MRRGSARPHVGCTEEGTGKGTKPTRGVYRASLATPGMPGCPGVPGMPGDPARWLPRAGVRYQSIKWADGTTGVAPCHRPYWGPHCSGYRGRAGPRLAPSCPQRLGSPRRCSVPSFSSTEGREKKMKFRSNHVRINHSSALREGTFTTIIIAITPFLSPSEDGFHSAPLSSFCLFRESRAPPQALAAPRATRGPAGPLYWPSCHWGCAGAGQPPWQLWRFDDTTSWAAPGRAGPPGSDPPAPTLCSGAGCGRPSPQPSAAGGGHSVGGHSGSPRGRSLSPSMAGIKPLLPLTPPSLPFLLRSRIPPEPGGQALPEAEGLCSANK